MGSCGRRYSRRSSKVCKYKEGSAGAKRNENWKTPETSDVPLKLIVASGEVGIQVIVELYQNSRLIGNTT